MGILIALVLIALAGGGAYYVVRQNRELVTSRIEKEAERLRSYVESACSRNGISGKSATEMANTYAENFTNECRARLSAIWINDYNIKRVVSNIRYQLAIEVDDKFRNEKAE